MASWFLARRAAWLRLWAPLVIAVPAVPYTTHSSIGLVKTSGCERNVGLLNGIPDPGWGDSRSVSGFFAKVALFFEWAQM